MSPGPRKKPARLKVLEGTYRDDRDGGGVNLPSGAPPEPHWPRLLPGSDAAALRREASAEWRRVVPDLHRVGVLAHVDRSSLASYCVQWAVYVESMRIIAREGLHLTETITNKAGATYTRRIRHPIATTIADCERALNRYRQAFGLDPSSRGRLNVASLDDMSDVERELFGD